MPWGLAINLSPGTEDKCGEPEGIRGAAGTAMAYPITSRRKYLASKRLTTMCFTRPESGCFKMMIALRKGNLTKSPRKPAWLRGI